jgi:hypothetical protein
VDGFEAHRREAKTAVFRELYSTAGSRSSY